MTVQNQQITSSPFKDLLTRAEPFKDLLTRAESAEFCRVSTKTFDRFRQHPNAPVPIRYNRRPYWSHEQLIDLIALHIRGGSHA